MSPQALDETIEKIAQRPTTRDLEAHRAALTGHCYRMLGSAIDADDAVQDTMIRALRSIDGFDGRSSLRTWLYRIATNVCLDALADRKRRERPVLAGPLCTVEDELVEQPREYWIEPIPDVHVVPENADPAERVMMRQSVRLAFVAALQHLPPKQRASLLLTEVLDWSAAEVAACLDTSVAAVNSALQRARATLSTRDVGAAPEPLSSTQATLLTRYVDAFERYDMEALTALLHEDATLSMPPYTLWLRGHASITGWMVGRGCGCRGSKLVATAANGLPAFGQYRAGAPGEPYKPWSLIVLELSGDRIAALNHFLDVQTLFPRFGLPMELPS